MFLFSIISRDTYTSEQHAVRHHCFLGLMWKQFNFYGPARDRHVYLSAFIFRKILTCAFIYRRKAENWIRVARPAGVAFCHSGMKMRDNTCEISCLGALDLPQNAVSEAAGKGFMKCVHLCVIQVSVLQKTVTLAINHTSAHPSIHLSTHPSIRPSVHPSNYPSIH